MSDEPPIQRQPNQPNARTQWAGIALIASAISLATISAFGIGVFSDSTLRLFLGAGIILLFGREVAMAYLGRG